MEEKYIEILSKLGISIPEAKAYLALIELKESQTGIICEKSKIPSSKIYTILDSLVKKGFASYRLQNNIKVFMPSNPEIINEIFKEKREKIEEENKEIVDLIKELKTKQIAKESFSKYKYFEGIMGIKSVWNELTEYMEELDKNSIIKLHAGVKESYEQLLPFYEEFHKKRKKLGIRYQVIFPLEENKMGKIREKQLAEVKYTNLKNQAEFAVIGNKLLLWYTAGKIPRAFLIEDEVFAESHEQIFDSLWKIATK